MNDFVSILTNFGFPIALCVYLLARFEKILTDVSKSNDTLISSINILISEIKELKDLQVRKKK
jgi:hypothetical protein